MSSGNIWRIIAALAAAFPLATVAVPQESATPAPPAAHEMTPAEIGATVRARMAAELLRQKTPSAGSIRRTLAQQRADGSWPDVPYDRRDRSIWPPQKHLTRLTSLAIAYGQSSGPLHGDPALKSALIRGLEFWLKRDPQSDNWWHNVIAAPQELTRFLVLMRDDLPPPDFALACDRVRRSKTDRMTGANLAWTAGNLFALGAITDDPALMRDMLGLITSTIRITTDEGVQPDWSFHQHGPQLNAGNYGLAFIDTCGIYGTLVRGTPLAFPPEQVEILSNFALNFQDWVIWGNRMDLSSCGRQLDQPNAQTGKARALARGCTRLAALDPAHAPALNHLSDRAAGRLPATAGAPTGNRCFWRSDFMVHRPGTWYASIKTYSPRILRTETQVNSENYKGYHLCDGVLFVMVRGDEYADIQPVWDWRKLPGITYHETTAPLPYGNKAGFLHNPRDFVGGASDGEVGAAVLDLAKDDVTGKKAWFCFHNGIVCLGAGIASAAPERAFTDINQCLLRGPAMILAQGSWRAATTAQQNLPPATQAVYHDRIGYLFLAPANAVLTCGPQTGAWSDLRKEGVRPAKVTVDVFNLWIDHGPQPKDAAYAYAVVPGIDQPALAQAAAAPPWRVLANTPQLQAVASAADGLVQAVFYEPGRLEKSAAPAIAASTPCVLLVRTQPGGALDLTVSDPTQKLTTLKLSVDGPYSGANCRVAGNVTEVNVPLPSAGLAGSSVTVHLAATL